MLVNRRICRCDAVELCGDVLRGLEYADDNDLTNEYRSLYSAILSALNGGENVVPTLSARRALNPLAESQKVASEILASIENGPNETTLRKFLSDRRGWFEVEDCKYDDDQTIQRGWGVSYYLVAFYPAVRLALCALGATLEVTDPGYVWVQSRCRAALLAKEARFHMDFNEQSRREWLAKLEQAVVELPEDENLYAAHGCALVLDGQYENAIQSLERALRVPSFDPIATDGVYYNLACAHARLNNVEICRRHLSLSTEIGQLQLKWLLEDQDLESVRGMDWFQSLVESLERDAAKMKRAT
ncbi:MAG: hypothetical protein C0483_11475 [Pirellula sp.]|nr:hypothetical protein [Pirellula sp.]